MNEQSPPTPDQSAVNAARDVAAELYSTHKELAESADRAGNQLGQAEQESIRALSSAGRAAELSYRQQSKREKKRYEDAGLTPSATPAYLLANPDTRYAGQRLIEARMKAAGAQGASGQANYAREVQVNRARRIVSDNLPAFIMAAAEDAPEGVEVNHRLVSKPPEDKIPDENIASSPPQPDTGEAIQDESSVEMDAWRTQKLADAMRSLDKRKDYEHIREDDRDRTLHWRAPTPYSPNYEHLPPLLVVQYSSGDVTVYGIARYEDGGRTGDEPRLRAFRFDPSTQELSTSSWGLAEMPPNHPNKTKLAELADELTTQLENAQERVPGTETDYNTVMEATRGPTAAKLYDLGPE